MFYFHYSAKILEARVLHTWLIIRVKSFSLRPKAYPHIRYGRTNGQTDRQTDGDNHANNSTVT